MASSPLPRVILHLDMDAFYAAVEIREDPSLRGKPLIIGHPGRRGVVSTCSYEAREFGVHSAMPSVTAKRLCPDAIWRRGRMGLYVEISRAIRTILADTTPLVEPISIDEAFLDLTGIAPGLQEGRRVALDLKQRIRDQQQLTASVGVAENKFLAKIASDLEKPDGLVVFPLSELEGRLWPLPVKRLWGVGPRTAQRLRGLSIRTIGDILRVPASHLEKKIGAAAAAHLRALARGEDDRPVQARQIAKSVSEERTYSTDLRGPDEIDRAMLERAEGVSRELRRCGLRGRTIHLKVRTGDFTTWTRAVTLPHPTDLSEVIVGSARRLFSERIHLEGKGVRLLGIGVSGFEAMAGDQGELFSDPARERARDLVAAVDKVRDRFGEQAVQRARLLRRGGKKKPPPEASSLPSVD